MNNRIDLALSFLYVAIGAIEIATEITESRAWHVRSKPLLVLLVIALFLVRTYRSKGTTKTLVLVSLFFSWIGDVMLMYKEQVSWSFLGGLLAFLIAHIFLIAAYRMGSEGRFQLSFFIFVPVIGYGVVLYSVLAPHLGTMHIPVAVYAVVLLSMFVAALERRQRVSQESFWWAFGGAICFVLSDSILAWHSFVQPSVVARVLLMTLYIAAQYAIARGMALHITTSQQQS